MQSRYVFTLRSHEYFGFREKHLKEFGSFESEENPSQNVFRAEMSNVKFSSTVPKLRQAESARHGDIVQERFIDSYYNLTVKTLMVVKWATQNCDNFSYVLKERWRERGHRC